MIQDISFYFSKKLASNSEEQEVLQYGFECLINTLICSCSIITVLHIILVPIINDNDLIENYRKYQIIGLIIIIVESALMLIFNFYNIGIHSCLFFSLVSAVFLHYVERGKRLIMAN